MPPVVLAMAEFIPAPEERLYRMPDNVGFIEAAMTEPAAVSLGAVQLARWNPGDTVLVTGPGSIGLIIVQLCNQLNNRNFRSLYRIFSSILGENG